MMLDTRSEPGPPVTPHTESRTGLLTTYRWPIIVSTIGALALGAWGVRWRMGPLITTEVVQRRDFVQAVVASGHVETPHRVDISAQITGTVLHVPVAEGQVVNAGDLLVELESSELSASGRQAVVAVAQARARLRQLQEVQGPVAAQTLRQARASLDNARASLARSETLFSKGLIDRSDIDEARRTAQLADAQVSLTQKQLETTGPTGSDRAVALADVAGAQANAQAARARSGYALMKAPVTGTLIGRNVEVGDVVQPGKVLMTLSPGGRTQIVVQVDEKNLYLLALGQQALVSADAYPAQRFSAELVYINPGVNAQTGAVEIKLDTVAPPAVLRQDMTVSVDIEVARRPSALLIPADAAHDPDSPAPWVLRVENGHAVRTAVRLGLRSGGFAEVLDGLREGDTVIPATAAVAAGSRLRVRVTPPAASAPSRAVPAGQ